MHSSFEPLLLQIKASSYQSTSNLPYNIQASNPSSPKKPPKNPLSQTLQSFSQKRNRQQSAPSRTAKRKTTLAKSNGKDSSLNFNTTSFLKLFLKNPKETSQENSIQKLSNKLQAFKAPINTVITLEDLALKRRQTNKDGNNMYRNQNQSMDGKLNMQVHRSDKDITIRLDGHTSFQEYNPNESPISDDNTVGKLDRRARTADRFRRQGDMNYTMNETFEVSRETKAVELSLTQTDKVFKKVTNGSRKGKDFANLSMEMNNTTNSSKKASTAYGIAFGRRGINLDLTREKSQNKTRLDTLNDSCEGSVEKVSTKRKEPPKRFDVYHQIATEEERERMYKFLKDDFVNEMLMNRFCVDMDKFQIRDAINDINKKVNQDKLLRKKFQDFLKNGVIKAPMPAEKRKEHGKKTSFLDIGPPRRKNSETYAPEVSADPISVIDGHEEEPKSKNTRKSREAVMDLLRVKGREGLTVAPIELRKKTHSPQEAMRSARTNSREDELLSSKDSKDDEEYRREMHKIRLMEMKKKLNYKFNKGGSKSDIDETTPTGPMLGSKSFLDQEGSHSFIKAVKNGDCKAIKKFLDSNPALASTCDLMKQSALHWAAKEGHLQACQILVEAGANVNALDMADKTPLYYALKEKYPAIVKFLLSCETGALSIKAATYGSLGEGIELLETLKQAQPIVAVQPPNKVNAQKNAKYSIRVAPPPRRDSKMAIKLIGLNKTQESII